MGWTQHPDSHPTYAEEKREITCICLPWVPLQMSKVGSTWYVAAQHQDHVTAFVILTHTKGGWSYKDMDENMGPTEAKAPVSLIRKLTGPDKSGWRQRCLDYAARPKFKVGDKVHLPEPARFTNYPPMSDFTVVEYETRGKRRKCFHNPLIGLCRLSPYILQGATKL